MREPVVLLVDDEADILELLKMTLEQMKIKVITATNYQTALKAVQAQNFDLCLTDMKLPDGNGLDLVAYIQANSPSTPTAVITAFGSVELAVTALKVGAFDFISKPINLKSLRELISAALRLPSRQNSGVLSDFGLLGETSAIQEMVAKIHKLARSQAPVHISGESGVGKELVAQLIHQLGPRCESTFIPVNCGAIPEHLMESEFFGHKKGSFTGAIVDKQGLFQAANKGTLFLDEVADLPISMQVKLLRAIQEKAVRPIGAQHEISVDVRILSATHKNLPDLVKMNQFRQDLYYRINVIEIHVPSLRERTEDIPLLADYILAKLSKRSNNPQPKLSDTALSKIKSYKFPGNIRELENILERAMTLCENNIITQDDIHLEPSSNEELDSLEDNELDDENAPLENYLGSIEKERIKKAIAEAHGNKTKAAKLLGISFRALRYRLKKLGME